MKITCWGARGSIAVSGREYEKYGGDTTCIEIRSSENDIIIIDAGTGMRKLGNKLLTEEKRSYNLLLTHAHWDHLMGFPFFKPIYMKGTRIDMYGCPFTQDSIKAIFARSMVAPYFPVEFNQIQAEITSAGICSEGFHIGPMHIEPIHLSHPNQGIGYKFSENGKSFVFLTDNELTLKHSGGCEYGDYLRFSEGADLLIHDAEYTEAQYKMTKGWGHSVYTDALRLAMESGVKQFGLFHHNQERLDEDLDRMVEDCKSIAAQQGKSLQIFAAQAGQEMVL
ncbi:MAG: MBL fold metallo-hydrolase [Nitrospirota bacterium]|nr:MBL fold metallo-hydrolase [Nitrospirota bacterium]